MAWIKVHYANQLSVNAMAKVAGMNVSVFQQRFKAVTGVSPLQYQKHIRLHEARRRLITERAEAASVGYAVGYESTSELSREYRRLFGAPPRRDAWYVGSGRAGAVVGRAPHAGCSDLISELPKLPVPTIDGSGRMLYAFCSPCAFAD